MRKLIRVLLLTLVVIFSMSIQYALADEDDYHSNGQTSFYGTYINQSEEEKKDQSKKIGPYDIKKLPNTGDSMNSAYVVIGALLISMVGLKVYSERKEGMDI